MMRLTVKGIGVTGGFGCGIEELAAALRQGSATAGTMAFSGPQGELRVPAYRADTGRLEEFLPPRGLRRIDHYSKLALLGACLAMKDGGMQGCDLSRVGVIVASGFGATATTLSFVESMIDGGDLCASPTHFANSVHNSAAATISVMLGITGPSLTVSQFDMSLPSALVTARQWLSETRVDAVLLGAVDEVSDLMAYLWYRQLGQGAAPPDGIRPLDPGTDTFIPGEGSAFLLLTGDGQEGYCSIDSVQCGSITAGTFAPPRDSLFVLGADGRRELHRRYRDLLPSDSRVACYAPIYGSMPAAAGFDLACAALILQDGTAYPLAGAAGCDLSGKPAPLETERICALRLAGPAGYSAVHLLPM